MVQVVSNHSLKQLNTLQLQSVAEAYVEIKNLKQLEILWHENQKPLRWLILGGGSNLVLSQKISDLVVRICNQGKQLCHEDKDSWTVEIAAGENWHESVLWTLQKGLAGFENLSLIPGTVGAAPIQNIGAYGVEVKDLIESVTCFDLLTGKLCTLSNSDCRFSYRDSFFKQEGAGRYIVWNVRFKLHKNRPLQMGYGDVRRLVESRCVLPTAQDVSQAIIEIRQSKLPDPLIIGNAGSFFKNPIISTAQFLDLHQKFPAMVAHPYLDSHYKVAAGWLIESAGWKGQSLGPVAMYEKQALVLINQGGAVAEDVWNLAAAVSQDVYNKFGIHLEPEPIRW